MSTSIDLKCWWSFSIDVTIGPIDPLNPQFGYEIQVRRNGIQVLSTNKHPVTGADLTYKDCLEVAAMYG
jgi:hypothetical protein